MSGWSVAGVVVLGIVAVSSSFLLRDGLSGRTRHRNAPPCSPSWPSWPGAPHYAPSPGPFVQRPQAAHEGHTTALIIGVVGLAFVALCALVSLVLVLH